MISNQWVASRSEAAYPEARNAGGLKILWAFGPYGFHSRPRHEHFQLGVWRKRVNAICPGGQTSLDHGIFPGPPGVKFYLKNLTDLRGVRSTEHPTDLLTEHPTDLLEDGFGNPLGLPSVLIMD